jgi:hypothetical protein
VQSAKTAVRFAADEVEPRAFPLRLDPHGADRVAALVAMDGCWPPFLGGRADAAEGPVVSAAVADDSGVLAYGSLAVSRTLGASAVRFYSFCARLAAEPANECPPVMARSSLVKDAFSPTRDEHICRPGLSNKSMTSPAKIEGR